MRLAFRKTVIVVALLTALGAAEIFACSNAEASYGFNDVLGTIGIATGIGAVIGLSTIAFYDAPTTHLRNALIGAGAGAVVGLGVAAYLMSNSTESQDIDPDELLQKKPGGPGKVPGKDPGKASGKDQGFLSPSKGQIIQLLASVPGALAMRASRSHEWGVGMQLLELRF